MPSFKALLEAADIIHADGQPVVLASKFLTQSPIPERSATTDFIHDAAATRARLRPEDLSARRDGRCERALRRHAAPDLSRPADRRPAQWLFQPRGRNPTICDAINQSGADIVFVGLGVPLEYEFCVRNKPRLRAGWIVTCGGCFNFVTGDYTRRPTGCRHSRWNGSIRLAREPRRLFWRYAVTNPLALFLLLTRTA